MSKLPSYECPRCQMVSYNPNDIANRYCGNCHVFENDVPLHSVAIARLIEEVRVEKEGPPTGYNRTYSRHNR